ncbi:MAG: patatin family protein [Bacillota bacterium]|nr:patatin family protein [Bacillota bacterium]
MKGRIGLVLEGGGMRGLFTAGVLDFLMDNNLYFPYVIGVSMGACNAASYISRQRGRNKVVDIDYIDDPRYLSIRNLIREKSLFGMDFIFREIPNKHNLFDYDTFYNSEQSLIVGTTDCCTGKPVYFGRNCGIDILTAIRASSSLPFISPMVEIGGRQLLDGGISDPIPINKAIQDGCEKLVVVLTRNKGYIKKPFKLKAFSKRFYSKHSNLTEALVSRHVLYNETLKRLEQLEEEGRAFIIRPEHPLKVKRIEKNKTRLEELYVEGFKEAELHGDKLKGFIMK